MSATQSEERKPLPSVEYSQKYMSWHLKDISASLKSVDDSLKKIVDIFMRTSCPNQKKDGPPENNDIPF